MFAEPEFWVAVAFVLLMAVFAYFGIHRTVLTTLDHRSSRIKAELDDARRLKDEAARLLAEYQARGASAEREAQDIIASARADAERIAADAKIKTEEFVARRTRTAEQDRAGGSASRGGRSRRRRRCRRECRFHDPFPIGKGRCRPRFAVQGDCGSSRKAELSRAPRLFPGYGFFPALTAFGWDFSDCGSKPM